MDCKMCKDITTKGDMSATCGMHYDEYWWANNIYKTMSREDFDQWLRDNCFQCCYMSEVCMKE